MYVLKTHSKFEKSMSSFGNLIEKMMNANVCSYYIREK